MIQTVPLKLNEVAMRSHNIIGFHELNGRIVFVHSILGNVPKEQITKDTVFPKYIVADFLSADFVEHTQDWLMYSENKTFFPSCCGWEYKEDCMILNTMHYQPVFDNDRHNTLAKLIEVRDGSICEIGESPEPVREIFSSKKTFTFGDYVIRMASEFIVECISQISDSVVWRLRLNAWLYTDIEEKDGVLYFGTAGRGGRFYGISLYNGNVFFAYDTGGTTKYELHEKKALVVDRKGDILFINAKTGIEEKRISVKIQRQRLYVLSWLLRESRLYLIAQINKVPYHNFYAVCVDL